MKQKKLTLYIIQSLLSYVFIFLFIYFSVDFLKFDTFYSYVSGYGLNYLATFFIQNLIFSQQKASPTKALRFILHVFIFYVLNVFSFWILIHNDLNHYIAIFINIVAFFPLRFLSSKYIVFK